MFGICRLVVSVAVDIVGQEADGLHVREEGGGVGKERYLCVGQESGCRFEIAFGESLEDVHAEFHFVEFGRVFGLGVGGCAQEIAVVAEDERGHYGIEVDYAEDVAVGVEHHVVDLRVAVADAFGKLIVAEKAFGLGHVLAAAEQVVNDRLNLGEASGGVGLDGVVELLEAEFHVVEVGDCLDESVGDIDELGLEVSESLAGHARVVGVNGVEGEGIGDETRHAPVVSVKAGVGLVRSVLEGDECQDAAVDVVSAFFGEFLAEVVGDGHDVVLETIYVREDVMVDALEHVGGSFRFSGFHDISVVDEAVAERRDFHGSSFDVEKGDDVLKIFHCMSDLKVRDYGLFREDM